MMISFRLVNSQRPKHSVPRGGSIIWGKSFDRHSEGPAKRRRQAAASYVLVLPRSFM